MIGSWSPLKNISPRREYRIEDFPLPTLSYEKGVVRLLSDESEDFAFRDLERDIFQYGRGLGPAEAAVLILYGKRF